MKKQPMRTCVVCKNKFDKRDLLRIVRTPQGGVMFDATGKANGRGAYLCGSDACLEQSKIGARIASTLEVKINENELLQIIDDIRNYQMKKK